MLSRACPWNRLTPGLNRNCRMLIGLSTSTFTSRPRRQNHHPARPNPSPIISIYLPLVPSIRFHPLYLSLAFFPNVPCPPPAMHETHRIVEAASAHSAFLQTRWVPHAFYGDVLISLLANQPLAAVRPLVTEHRMFLTLCPPVNFMYRARRDTTSVPPGSGCPPFHGLFLNHLDVLV